MDVALHRADHDHADLRSSWHTGEVRLQLGRDGPHDLTGHHELGNERLAAGEALANHVHRPLAVLENADRVGPLRQQAVDGRQRVVLAQIDEGTRQFVCHCSSLSSPTAAGRSCASPTYKASRRGAPRSSEGAPPSATAPFCHGTLRRPAPLIHNLTLRTCACLAHERRRPKDSGYERPSVASFAGGET